MSPREIAEAGHSFQVYEAIRDVNAADWDRVCASQDARLFMDVRLLAAVESTMSPACRLWYVLFYDAAGAPTGCAVLCRMQVDLTIMAGAGFRAVVGKIRALWKSFLTVNVLFCGLPVSAGQSSIRFAPGADCGVILHALNRVAQRLAMQERAPLVVIKELAEPEMSAPQVHESLQAAGFRRAESLPMHTFPAFFPDFPAYVTALKTGYRSTVNRSLKRRQAAGLRVEFVRDPEIVRQLHTPEVHRLYDSVLNASENRLEVLPLAFFHEVARQLPQNFSYVRITQGDRVVGFSFGVHDQSTFYGLFCGMDYSLSPETDLYFNLIYSSIEDALNHHRPRIQLGQTASAFKSRLGCVAEPLYLYLRGTSAFAHWILNLGFSAVFPAPEKVVHHQVFNSQTVAALTKAAATNSKETRACEPPAKLAA